VSLRGRRSVWVGNIICVLVGRDLIRGVLGVGDGRRGRVRRIVVVVLRIFMLRRKGRGR